MTLCEVQSHDILYTIPYTVENSQVRFNTVI